MGMFDNINVADALPFTDEMKELGLDKNNRSWQTKDLSSTMSSYTIQGGRLFEQKYKTLKHINGDPNAEFFLDRIGRIKREDPYLEQIHHHGEIYFYDLLNDVDGKWDCWVEFKATFTHGVVESFELVRFDKKDNTARIQENKKWLEDINKVNSKWYNKYIRHTTPYKWFKRKWSSICMACGDFFHKIAYIL